MSTTFRYLFSPFSKNEYSVFFYIKFTYYAYLLFKSQPKECTNRYRNAIKLQFVRNA